MNDGDDWANDNINVVVPERVAATPPAPFYLDDAFSDGDDIDPYEFSSTVIRAELARSFSSPQDTEEASIGDSPQEAADASVSTLDIAGRDEHNSPSDSSPPRVGSFQLSSQFDQISLSEDPSAEQQSPENGAVHEDGNLSEHTNSTGDYYAETDHPSVYIDASQSHPVAHEVDPDSPIDSPVPRVHVEDADPEGSSSSSSNPVAVNKSVSTPSLPVLPVPTSPSGSSLPQRPSSGHKPTRSVGPSMFEKVVSKTRPSFLPPKSREEDRKHMADWEKMMKRSRALDPLRPEEKRRRALQDRRLAREMKVEQSLHIWEKEILPDWKVVHQNPVMRKLWWTGIPTKLRSTMWERAVGNALALSKGRDLVGQLSISLHLNNIFESDTYRICLARAKRALAAGTFPTTTLTLIEEDVLSTLPSLHIFHPETGPMYGDLKDMLYAWVVSRSDEGLGYARGIAKIAAMILLNMPAVQGFIVLRNLLERHCMRAFYGGLSTKDDVEAYYRIFDTLLADGMPKIYFNFKQHQISPSAYLPDWLMPLFLDHLPFEACARVWDVILLEGDSFLYRSALAILAVLEPRLFFPDRQELMELLRGENKAALEVARRDGRPLNGGKYEIYGLDEETLWDRIDSMDDWWKESTWTRLLQRELPDL
ncbi:RabGAP/TBC [Artomyces pyxidatus]|uniref:RabGAP/TBC n=1 Tax=Artomyces pyxidatus TaxID=48021 RepID=A0ACB8TI39_9AGAM|nr:RabGAP/TBC [Artomyces pyxidatus]